MRDKNAVPEDAYAGFEGVLVDRVDPDGIAARAGIGPGVLIRKIGHKQVTSVGEFAAAIEKESADDGILLQVRTPRGNSIVLLKKGG
ncbi:PDZ domain-containing protein [bacterium]|nr:PDZ domain-containing protein [bacterium]